ncbi:pyocin activator protein PrtN [Chromobacterium haemolyticum]|uniref:Pyocin activator protein PrtN n=1 Tax=Chromobacterium fluminis TaxID=3044269 RepID=A0ABX0L9T5_9NEIS|nr:MULTISPECIES: pyocin activator PrtN family protein [Chromobacterium]MCP1290899.1 pyocin activator PrtN family protein [Chromobacterium sp. S0633]NHR08374.1 pyocin activator protein PrtN [Chromobacterium haemolyticum]
MKTAFLLMAQYERPVLKLDDICEEYFGLSPAEARRRANLNTLPVPTMRLAESQKAPVMVHIDDLAQFIDKQRQSAKESWERSQL